MIKNIRMWNKKEKRMHDVCGFDLITGEIWDEFKNGSDIIDCTLMQSTGLIAINGQEVFEGDIVQVTYSDMEGETQVAENCIIKNIFDYDLREAAWLNHAHEIKIVGNIYENPELLEVSQ
jgi:uncharacterized phage protein (TIGR01671 family)